MKFEEMPVEVQKLFSEPYWGDVLYRPPPVPYPQPYIQFTDILAFGPFTYLEFVRPDEPWVYSASNPIGSGRGLSAIDGPAVLRRPPDTTPAEVASLNEPGLPPYNPQMEFYLTKGDEFAVVSARVFELLETNNAVSPGMWRDIYVAESAEDRPEQTDFRLIDFPRFAVVDYQKSHSNWSKCDPPSVEGPLYFARPHISPGKFATYDLPDAPGIVRDIRTIGLFIRFQLLKSLELAGVMGPDYSVLKTKLTR